MISITTIVRRAGRTGLALALIGLLAGCGDPQSKYTRYMERAQTYFEHKDYARARIEYRNALKQKQADPEALYRLGLVDEADGDVRSAFINYTLAMQQDLHFALPRLKLAQYHLVANAPDEAQKQIDAVLADTPDLPEAHALKGSIFLHRRQYDDAEKEARIALDKDPANASAAAVLTGIAMAHKNYADAAQAVENAIRLAPDNVSLAVLRATVYERVGNLEKTAEAYQDIFRLAPEDTGFRTSLAEIYARAGKTDAAEAILRDAIKALPQDWNLKHQIVVFLDLHRGIDAADKEAHVLAAANPDHPEIYFWLADLYMSRGDNDRAVAALQEVIAHQKLEEPGLNARSMLAMIRMKSGDKALAQSLADNVLKKDPDNKEALYVLSNLDFDQGNDAKVITDMRTVITRDPDFVTAYPLLAEALVRQGHVDLAIDALLRLIDREPDNTVARIRLAQFYAQSGNMDQAYDILKIVTRDHADDAVAWETMARIAIDHKNRDIAEAALNGLKSISGQDTMVAYLTGQMLTSDDKIEETIEHNKAVLAADPRSPLAEHALRSLIESEQKLGQLDEAVRFMEGLDPTIPFVSAMLGQSYMRLNRLGEAEDALKRATHDEVNDPAPYMNLASLYKNENKIDQAIDVLRKSSEVIPSDPHAPFMEATLEESRKNYDVAAKRYETLLTRFPKLDAAANNLAMIYADTKFNDAEALGKARTVAERFISSDNPQFLDTLAWVYYRQGDTVRALNVVKKMAAMPQTSLTPQAAYHQASILLKGGQRDDARALLAKAIQTQEPYTGLDDARAMAKELGSDVTP